MKKTQQNIVYTFVNQNTVADVKKTLQMAIIERLLLLHREKTLAKN